MTYFDATNRHSAVAEAAARWNGSGVNVRLVRTTSRRRANVVVSASRSISACGAGVTDYTAANGRMRHANVLIYGGRCSRENQVFALTHEFGHVLDLDHVDFGVLEGRLGDARVAGVTVRLYGGRAKPVRRNPFCPVPARSS